jgi:hypothetical protein
MLTPGTCKSATYDWPISSAVLADVVLAMQGFLDAWATLPDWSVVQAAEIVGTHSVWGAVTHTDGTSFIFVVGDTAGDTGLIPAASMVNGAASSANDEKMLVAMVLDWATDVDDTLTPADVAFFTGAAVHKFRFGGTDDGTDSLGVTAISRFLVSAIGSNAVLLGQTAEGVIGALSYIVVGGPAVIVPAHAGDVYTDALLTNSEGAGTLSYNYLTTAPTTWGVAGTVRTAAGAVVGNYGVYSALSLAVTTSVFGLNVTVGPPYPLFAVQVATVDAASRTVANSGLKGTVDIALLAGMSEFGTVNVGLGAAHEYHYITKGVAVGFSATAGIPWPY